MCRQHRELYTSNPIPTFFLCYPHKAVSSNLTTKLTVLVCRSLILNLSALSLQRNPDHEAAVEQLRSEVVSLHRELEQLQHETEVEQLRSEVVSEISIPNYELVRLDRNRHGGGVAIYVASHLPFSVVSSGSYCPEVLAISVKSPYGQFVVAVLYRLPSSSISFFENLHLALEDLYVTVCSNFYISGDFNVDVSVPSYLCSCLCNVTCQYGLSIIPTSHTCVTTSSCACLFTRICHEL